MLKSLKLSIVLLSLFVVACSDSDGSSSKSMLVKTPNKIKIDAAMQVESNGSIEGVWLIEKEQSTFGDLTSGGSGSYASKSNYFYTIAIRKLVGEDNSYQFLSCNGQPENYVFDDSLNFLDTTDINSPGKEISSTIEINFSDFNSLFMEYTSTSDIENEGQTHNQTYTAKGIKVSHAKDFTGYVFPGSLAVNSVKSDTFSSGPISFDTNCLDVSLHESVSVKTQSNGEYAETKTDYTSSGLNIWLRGSSIGGEHIQTQYNSGESLVSHTYTSTQDPESNRITRINTSYADLNVDLFAEKNLYLYFTNSRTDSNVDYQDYVSVNMRDDVEVSNTGVYANILADTGGEYYDSYEYDYDSGEYIETLAYGGQFLDIVFTLGY